MFQECNHFLMHIVDHSKISHCYWFGVLLIARAIPLLIGTVSSTNSDRNTILSTIAVIAVTLVFQSRVYRKLYVSISESLFLLNLIFLAGSALYTLSIANEYYDIQEVFTSVLVGFAVLHFIGVTIFSTARLLLVNGILCLLDQAQSFCYLFI